MSITKFSVYKTKILLFKSIFVDRYISVYLYSTIANMLFNLETNVLKAKLVNMWHTKNEYAISEIIMAIFDHIAYHAV
jgi:hypothetical protein